MVDYYPVLNGAVAALNPNTPEARLALYDRARRAMVDGLRSSDPSLSDTDLTAQTSALEDAVRKVEAQFGGETDRSPDTPSVAPVRMPPPPPPVAARAASEPDMPPSVAETDDYEDRPPLDEDRKPFRMIAAGVAVLAVLLGGALAYTYWPSKQPATKTASAPTLSRAPAPRRVDADPTGAGGAGYVFLRQPVYYRTTHPVGTIVVDKSQNFLYVVRPSVSAIRYGIGVGPECNGTAGLYQIVRKEEWPGLKTAAAAAEDERNKNPFGARALYLSKESRIHGTNAPATIGRPASLGCIRLTNDDVIHLYERSPLETRVVVVN